MNRAKPGPLDHQFLVKTALESSSPSSMRALGSGFASARTAVNIMTTVEHSLARGSSMVLLILTRMNLGHMESLVGLLRRQRMDTESWLSDPDTIEKGRELALERQIRSTQDPNKLHPRYGLLGDAARWLLRLRTVLYLVQICFDWPYLFSYFLGAFNGPVSPELADWRSNPVVLSAALLAVIPTAVLALITELTAPAWSSFVHGLSKAHARQHAQADLWLSAAVIVGLSAALFRIAQSRFASAGGFQANAGGQLVGEILVGALPAMIMILAIIAHNPRMVEATRRRTFSRLLARRQHRTVRRQSILARRLQAVYARISALFSQIQAHLDLIGAVGDQQITMTALNLGVYGETAPSWHQARTLGSGTSQPRDPVFGRPTTLVTSVANYVNPRLYVQLARFAQVEDAALDTRDLTALFDAFRANPESFAPAKAEPTGSPSTAESMRKLPNRDLARIGEKLILPASVKWWPYGKSDRSSNQDAPATALKRLPLVRINGTETNHRNGAKDDLDRA